MTGAPDCTVCKGQGEVVDHGEGDVMTFRDPCPECYPPPQRYGSRASGIEVLVFNDHDHREVSP